MIVWTDDLSEAERRRLRVIVDSAKQATIAEREREAAKARAAGDELTADMLTAQSIADKYGPARLRRWLQSWGF